MFAERANNGGARMYEFFPSAFIAAGNDAHHGFHPLDEAAGEIRGTMMRDFEDVGLEAEFFGIVLFGEEAAVTGPFKLLQME